MAKNSVETVLVLHALVDLGEVGDADRAARAHDHVELLREERAESELDDGLLVAAADVHDGDLAAAFLDEARQRLRHRACQPRIAELQVVHDDASISLRTSMVIRSFSMSSRRSIS